MEMTYVSGRSFYSLTTGNKKENGEWEVTVKMSEKVRYPNGTDREESIEHTGVHQDFDAAHKIALRNVMQELQDLVYSRGFDSLVEGKDYERSLETTDGDTIKFDAITPSE
jgi:hypothetical protein